MRKCSAGVNLQAAREGIGAKVPHWSHPLHIVGNLSFPQTPRTSPEKVRSKRTCYFLKLWLTSMYASLVEVGGVTRAV